MEHITVKQAALSLGVSEPRIRQLCTEGRLMAAKFGRQWILDPSVIDNFVRVKAGRPRKVAE